MTLKITLAMACITFSCFSQITITGTITHEEYPLIGASILIKNSDSGTISDIDGDFELKVKKTDTLVVSYLGFNSQEIPVGNQKYINVGLSGSMVLDEVEVIAFASTYCRAISCYGVVACTTECYDLNESLEKAESVANPSKLISQLYPNPSQTGKFQIKFFQDYAATKVQVFNSSGQLVKTISAKPQNKKLGVDLSAYSSGIYLVAISASGKHIATKKTIVE